MVKNHCRLNHTYINVYRGESYWVQGEGSRFSHNGDSEEGDLTRHRKANEAQIRQSLFLEIGKSLLEEVWDEEANKRGGWWCWDINTSVSFESGSSFVRESSYGG